MRGRRLPGQESGQVGGTRSSPCGSGFALTAALLGGSPDSARAQDQHHSGQQPPGQRYGGHPLGTIDFPSSCSEQAQPELERAVALLHHMTYPQAREVFTQVTTIDPKCAMAHWGILADVQGKWKPATARGKLL